MSTARECDSRAISYDLAGLAVNGVLHAAGLRRERTEETYFHSEAEGLEDR